MVSVFSLMCLKLLVRAWLAGAYDPKPLFKGRAAAANAENQKGKAQSGEVHIRQGLPLM
eukprot:COSAG05_NODE_358_length_10812_cov_90.986372_5_plen_59_part_00